MSVNRKGILILMIAALAVMFVAATSFAQGGSAASRSRTVSIGEKMKIKGVIIARDAETMTVQDLNGVDTVVKIASDTKVEERKSNPFRGSKKFSAANLIRGLNVEVEGRGDSSGRLVAEKIKFSEEELKFARAMQTRVEPVEGRVGTAESRIGQVEQNAQRLSGQIDELVAVSNAARGGARAAQESADAAQKTANTAVQGVNQTNDRISALDDYVVQDASSVNFKVNSSVLSKDAQAMLDSVAQRAMVAKGYVIEVSGYTDTTGSVEKNRRLSQQRADAVVRYLAEMHKIPLRRIITPFGYGENDAVADNTTREGREKNRRVEVKLLVNRGLTQQAPAMQTGQTIEKPN